MFAELRLPLTPSVNHYYHSMVMGAGKKASVRVYISKDGRAYKDEVKAYLRAARFPHFGHARLQVDIVVHFADARHSDIDNRLKPLLDSLSDEFESAKDAKKAGRVPALLRAGLWRNDKQIDDLRISRGAPIKGGAMVVYIQVIGEPPIAEQIGLEMAA